tara:strand:- start:899 stop:1324 length:426 start_codon:yes stop_codon:yes gene_type:complete
MNKNYKHKTTGQACNAAQYIAEMVCLREAEKERVGRPAYALWNTETWQKKFKSQVTKAYQLIKKYSDKAIINALNSYKGKNIYSLRVKFLEPIIQNEQKALDKIDNRDIKEVEYKDNTLEKPRKPFGKKGKLSRLKDLEHE